MGWASAIGDGAARSFCVIAGDARHRIRVAAPPVSLEFPE
jgi:hypothetical protein